MFAPSKATHWGDFPTANLVVRLAGYQRSSAICSGLTNEPDRADSANGTAPIGFGAAETARVRATATKASFNVLSLCLFKDYPPYPCQIEFCLTDTADST